MTPRELSDQSNDIPLPFNFDPSAFAAVGQKRLEELAAIQNELFQEIQEANRRWTERLLAETKLSAEFASRMMSTGSIPEAINIMQEWTSHRFEMVAKDGQRLLDDTQKFIATGVRLTSSWQRKGPAVGI